MTNHTISITVDDDLLTAIDAKAARLGVSREFLITSLFMDGFTDGLSAD